MHTEFRHVAAGSSCAARRTLWCVSTLRRTPSAALAVLLLMAGNSVVVRAPLSIPLSTMYV